MLDAQAERLLTFSPATASLVGLDTGARAPLRHRLDDTSPGVHAAEAALCIALERELKAFPADRLSPTSRLHRAVVLYAYALGREARPYDFGTNGLFSAMSESAGPYVVSQQSGTYSELAEFLDTQHQIETRDDAEAFLDRLAQSARALDGETERVRHDAARGVTPPTYILDIVLGEMDGQLKTPPEQSRFVQTVARKTAARHLTGDWEGPARRLVLERYTPALARQRDALKAIVSGADDRAGVWRFNDGESYYAWLLKQGTTTTLSAAEIHQKGLDQNQEIGARMDQLLRAQGLTQGSVGDRMSVLSQDPRNRFSDTDAGRQQALNYLQSLIAAMRARMGEISALNLRAPVEVRRVPEDIQAGADLGYMNFPSLDGSRPSIYYINLMTMTNWPRYAIPTLTHHETIPGHAWQFAYLRERAGMPMIRQILSGFNAYVEGWALYAEQLTDEIGMYDDDPLGRLGYLQAQKFRAVRLVIDTGLHSRRWTREQAIAYGVAESGRASAAMTTEIDRYIGTPGQACGYKIGHNQMNRLRESEKARLGPRFDLVSFNDAVVRLGPAPLEVMAAALGAYLPA